MWNRRGETRVTAPNVSLSAWPEERRENDCFRMLYFKKKERHEKKEREFSKKLYVYIVSKRKQKKCDVYHIVHDQEREKKKKTM
jgi:hypothetical protein